MRRWIRIQLLRLDLAITQHFADSLFRSASTTGGERSPYLDDYLEARKEANALRAKLREMRNEDH